MEKTKAMSIIETLTADSRAIESLTVIETVASILEEADKAADVATASAKLDEADAIVSAVNAKCVADTALGIADCETVNDAWEMYLATGAYFPYKVTAKTKKGVTTHSLIQGDKVIIRPETVFKAFKERHGVAMTGDAYMLSVTRFYWAFAVNKAGDYSVVPPTLNAKALEELKAEGKIPSGNSLENRMNLAAKAVNPTFTGKLYRKNLIAINDFLINGKVFKATIGNENKMLDALVRCMMLSVSGKDTELVARGKCFKADK